MVFVQTEFLLKRKKQSQYHRIPIVQPSDTQDSLLLNKIFNCEI